MEWPFAAFLPVKLYFFLKTIFHTFPSGLRAPCIYQRLPSLLSCRDSTVSRYRSEKWSLMLILLSRNNETRHRDTMTRTSFRWVLLLLLSVFEVSIVFHVVISWWRTTVVERIEPMEHETQLWGKTILVISYVVWILALYASRTCLHLSSVLLDI